MIAVIGHGKSPEGRGWGKRIDGALWVIKMWNCQWQTAEDHGARYDWGLIETHRKLMKLWRENNQHTPSMGWLVSILDRYQGWQAEVPKPARFIEQTSWLRKDWAIAIGGCGATGKWELTRGGLAACWAIEHAPPGEEIVLVGFDNLHAQHYLPLDVGFSQVYQDDPMGCWIYPSYVPEGTKDGNHDVVAERKLVEIMTARRGDIRLSFAQDVWR
jgi:hypothetical protein